MLLISLAIACKTRDQKPQAVAAPANEYVAELLSANGMVFVGKPGRTEWNQAAVGARLMEGDLVQTDSLGEATIRYTNGNAVSIQASTIFTVRNSGDGSMEIGVPYQDMAADAKNPSAEADAKNNARPGTANFTKESSPFIKLERIVPFGRSLELIGKVEAGSRLVVNNESVEVAGDGSFKHFTNQFPAAIRRANLIMRVTNLAGHTRVISATHDFEMQDADK